MEKSNVTIELFDEKGEKIFTVLEKQKLLEGRQDIKFNGNLLEPGIYKVKITIENMAGMQTENSNIKVS